MRPIVISQGAAGFTNWKKVDPHKQYWGVGFGVTLSASANLTYSVQHSFDDTGANIPCQVTRSTTTLTITFPAAHGLTTSDSVIISGGSPWDGNYAVASVSSSTVITVTVANTGATSYKDLAVSPMRIFNHSSVVAKTTAQDGNYAYPIFAVRLIVTAYTTGVATLTFIEAGIK